MTAAVQFLVSSHQQGCPGQHVLRSDPVLRSVESMRCRQGRKAAPASSLSAHSEFAMEASHRLMADDRAHLRTDGGAGADAQASAQLQSASASGLRLRKVTALHQGSAGADKPVVSIDGGDACCCVLQSVGKSNVAALYHRSASASSLEAGRSCLQWSRSIKYCL